jgi:hypothetical protein
MTLLAALAVSVRLEAQERSAEDQQQHYTVADLGSGTQAASAVEPTSNSVVPRLIQFNGTVRDAEGKPAAGSVELTFSLYQLHDGGGPLWAETQTAHLDAQGRYTVLLGAASPDGLPQDVFTNGAARWLGVQPAMPGIGELPRVLLVGVPYALKAADAETLGGKPASAYVTTETFSVTGASGAPGSAAPVSATSTSAGAQDRPTVAAGRQRKQASGANPLTACTSVTADGTATANFVAKFTSACVIHQSALFESGGNVGIGNTSPAGKLDVSGNAFVRGTFNLNQTTSASVGVINMGSSPFIHACCSSSADNTFVGVNAGNFGNTGASHNTGTGVNALHANTTGAENTAAGYFALSSNTNGSSNTATGHEALSSNTSGFNNTATGFSALLANGTGHDNTADGDSALNFNTTGSFNTAVGETALGSNTTGSFNTALGYNANVGSSNLTNATAVGAHALAGASNSLVLGGTGTNAVSVGIGTTTPGATLDITVPNTGVQNLLFFGDTVGGSGDVAKITYDASSSPFPLTLNLTSNGGFARPFEIVGGNVGIGTNVPDNLLTVNGSADKPGGGSWGTFSDRRLKTVEATYDAGLDAILKLTPVRYRYKHQNAMGIKDDQEHIGFVAQEVEKVIPEAVSENSRGYLLVNNDPILWTMLNAIKQQQAEIEALTCSAHEKDAQIQKLTQEAEELQKIERQMAALEGRLAQVEVKRGNSLAVASVVASRLTQ